MNITYEEYKTALDIVLNYQNQILDSHQKVEKKQGTILLSDYLKSLNNIKYHNSIKKWWRNKWANEISFDECTIEYYLKLLSKDREPKRYFRGIGNESLNELFRTLISDFKEAEFLKHHL